MSLQDAFDYLIEFLEQPHKTLYIYQESILFYITDQMSEVRNNLIHVIVDNERALLRTIQAKNLK